MSLFRINKNKEKANQGPLSDDHTKLQVALADLEVQEEPRANSEKQYKLTYANGEGFVFKSVKSVSNHLGITEAQCKKFIDNGYKNEPKWAKDQKVIGIVLS